MEVQLGLPGGAVRVEDNTTVNDVKLRLWGLTEARWSCDPDAETARLALKVIEAMQRAGST